MPSLLCRVELPFFAASKQASTREMGKNHNPVVVLRIRLKFWWMIAMGVKYHHTQFEEENHRRRPVTGVASGGMLFQILSKMTKNCHFFTYRLGGSLNKPSRGVPWYTTSSRDTEG